MYGLRPQTRLPQISRKEQTTTPGRSRIVVIEAIVIRNVLGIGVVFGEGNRGQSICQHHVFIFSKPTQAQFADSK
jgi:hypothetical protein